MAYTFPNTPAGVLPPEVLRTFRALKALPDEWVIWHHLAPWHKDAPDFLILNAQQQALLVKVSGAAGGDVHPAAQLLLLQDDRPPPGEAEMRLLRAFRDSLNGAAGATLWGVQIPLVVVFPNIPDTALRGPTPSGEAPPIVWLGRDALQPGGESRWAALFIGTPLGQAALEALRSRFTPEVVVPPTLTVRQVSDRQLQAGLGGFLLDYNQEAACKADLDLEAEGQLLSKDFRLNVVNGVAGSGKTLILLYRLRLLQALYPDKRFLVLTHNRPLIHDMEARFHRLSGRLPATITWNTFQGWCRSQWPAEKAWIPPLSQARQRELVRIVWGEFFRQTPITERMLRSEIDWFKDQPFTAPEMYLQAERRGRGFRLMQEQRQRMFQAIGRYQQILEQRGWCDWGDVPRRIWEWMRQGQLALPEYDAVLVDEAQFFAPLWLEVIQGLVRPRSGHLFIVADPTQGFLGRGTSWKSLGLEVRGRTHQLRHSYRTTQEILDFATLFYRQRLPEGYDEDTLAPNLFDMPSGPLPEMIPLASPQDEIARVVNEIVAFSGQGFSRQHLLVLHANWQGAQDIIRSLQRKLGRGAALDPKKTSPGNYVRVTTLNAGAGLESPIVFLVGLNQLFEEEQSLRLSDEEREALMADNTRKVYMAATRAGQRLVFTYVGELPAALRRREPA